MKQYKVFVIANLIFGILLIALTKVILSALSLVVGIFVSLVPTVIVGTCLYAHMACHAVTAPVLAVTGVVVALFAAVNLVYLRLRRRNEQD